MNVNLTAQEMVMVLMLCCGGYREIDIARLLNRSWESVKAGSTNSFRTIYQKTGMASETELIAWFYR